METLLTDLRFALRQLGRSRGFTLVVLAMLAVGIGANTTVFSVVNALLLRPLPYPQSERLVQVSGAYEGRGDNFSVSYPNAVDWGAAPSLEGLGMLLEEDYSLRGGDRPERVRSAAVSANLFRVLGVSPVLGRGFTAAEDAPGGERVAVLGYGLWQRRFGGDPAVLGRTVMLSGRPYTVVGVMPRGFAFPDPDREVYTPLRASATTWPRSDGGLMAVARLKPGVTLERAQAELDAISRRLAAAYPATNADLTGKLKPLREGLYGGAEVSTILLTLLAAVALVLLIACANVANLLLARGAAREREIAVRTALGAGRGRLLRLLLTESLVLALVGGALGVGLALLGTRLFAAAIPAEFGLPREFRIDGVVLAFTLGVSLLTGVLFGLLPTLRASRTELTSTLREGGRGASAGVRRGRLRALLVVSEVTLAVVLLVSAGLMVRSLTRLLATDPGFDTRGTLTLRVALDARYATREQTLGFQRQVLERLRALPGAAAAGAVDWVPLGGTNNFNDFRIEGRAPGPRPENAGFVVITPGYLEAMAIPLVRGRAFDERDTRAAPGVVLVNQTFARKYWPDENPLGKRIVLAFEESDTASYARMVVGVVRDSRYAGLDQPPRPEMYVPFAQLPYNNTAMTLVVRTMRDPAPLTAAAQQAVWAVDAAQPVYDIHTMAERVHRSVGVVIARVLAVALAVFGAVALALAAIGLYGVVSYGVAQRTHEIGVRTALGATRGDVVRLVLQQGLAPVALGILTGVTGAAELTRLLRSLLHGVSPNDPVTFVAVPVVLGAVALLATWLPARRAAGVEPVVALYDY
ncbi:MAG: ABC transporter permease [Gemmatimonadetes bacterium]|nr:ABC transporter permease [Gemmatimonadota bacterium]